MTIRDKIAYLLMVVVVLNFPKTAIAGHFSPTFGQEILIWLAIISVFSIVVLAPIYLLVVILRKRNFTLLLYPVVVVALEVFTYNRGQLDNTGVLTVLGSFLILSIGLVHNSTLK